MPQITQLPILPSATDSTFFVVVDGNSTRRLAMQDVVTHISDSEVRGPTGPQGPFGPEGLSGTSGFSGRPGSVGLSGASGKSGFSGISGYSGYSGKSGFSGFTGRSGYSGASGRSGYSGASGTSGNVGISGYSGVSGFSGASKQCFVLSCGDDTTVLSTGTRKTHLRVPYNFALTEVRASLSTPQQDGNAITIDVLDNGSSIFSTTLTIDNLETSSVNSVITPVLSTSLLNDNDELTVDIVTVGDGTAAGLKVYLIGII